MNETQRLRMAVEKWRVIAVLAMVVAGVPGVAPFAVNASRRAERLRMKAEREKALADLARNYEARSAAARVDEGRAG